MNIYEESLKIHEAKRGKIKVTSKVEVKNKHDLSVVYSPGVSELCRKIEENKEESIINFKYR